MSGRGFDFGGQAGARANPRSPRVPSPIEYTFLPRSPLSNPRPTNTPGNPFRLNDILHYVGTNEGRATYATSRLRALSSSAAIGAASRVIDRSATEFYTNADNPGWVVIDLFSCSARLTGMHWQAVSTTAYLPLIIPIWGTNYLGTFDTTTAGNLANWERIGTFRANPVDGLVAFGWSYTPISSSRRYRYFRFDGHPDNPGGNNCFLNEIMLYGTVRKLIG